MPHINLNEESLEGIKDESLDELSNMHLKQWIHMNIFAEIEGIDYKIKLSSNLKEINFKNFNINTMPSCCLIKSKQYHFAISKWVSPKRTRSYPFERVYNTLSISKKITVIPVVKDEGAKGDRDFLQWDAVSLRCFINI